MYRSLRRSAAVALLFVAGCGSDGGGGAKTQSGGAPPAELGTVVPATPLGSIAGRPVGPQDGTIAWQRKLEGPVVPGPVNGPGDTVLAASNGGVLHSLDAATGNDRWTFDGGGTYGVDLSTSPVVTGGTVLWPGPQNTVFGLDAATGELQFKVVVDAQPTTPAVRGDRFYVQSTAGTLTAFALGAGTPRKLWQVDVGDASYSSPVVGPDGTVYTGAGTSLFAVRDGKVAWSVKTNNQVEVSPAIAADGTITIGSNDHHQYGVSPAGKVLWRYDLGDLTYSSPAVTPDDLIYVGDHRGLVSALDGRTGKLRYRVLGQGRTATEHDVGVWTRPAVDGRHDVYFGTRLGHVHGFDASGHRLLDVDLGQTVDSYPVITPSHLLVVGSESGTLTAIK